MNNITIEITDKKFHDFIALLKKFYDEANIDGYHGNNNAIQSVNEFMENNMRKCDNQYPVFIEFIGIVYKYGMFNSFGGFDIPYQQVLKSNAGYYIGTLYFDEEICQWLPNNRISESYFDNRKLAELELEKLEINYNLEI